MHSQLSQRVLYTSTPKSLLGADGMAVEEEREGWGEVAQEAPKLLLLLDFNFCFAFSSCSKGAVVVVVAIFVVVIIIPIVAATDLCCCLTCSKSSLNLATNAAAGP